MVVREDAVFKWFELFDLFGIGSHKAEGFAVKLDLIGVGLLASMVTMAPK